MMANICGKRFARLFTQLEAKAWPQRPHTVGKQVSRKSHGYAGYREWNWEPNRPFIQRIAHFNAALMWCYIYWSFRHNWRELVGEYVWPQRSEWSNEHLGIPPDDVD
ncbi:unnamed protein product [Medioppia subpectinata]|uniref:NADH dehydrogenase [ubiquinone] 1 beta subcomplex subunit 2 n=2 Tax=Medioppia subpectinata TaxID=1979941 RepID=A0A7R9L5Q1_9ACAR|nr:unnamed protein product [Medioppia subpectinata]CAG2114994.1 unnamed protein product [Medioppia subpectinata]